MEHLIRAVQARLKQRKLYRPALGLVIKEMMKPLCVEPAALQVKISWTTCSLFLSPAEDKPRRFLQKAELLERINKKLSDDGREVVFKELQVR
jgi:hypothetical protein